MTISVSLSLVSIATLIACRDHGSGNPPADELSKISPETFSHADPTLPTEEKCAGQDGILISPTSIGPVRLNRPLKSLRQSCDVALVKVPPSVAIKGPVLGVSVGGGLIIFTVSGKDSVIGTAGTSSPAFRTETGLGVSSGVGQLPSGKPTLCFRRDSVTVTEVFISRRSLRCWTTTTSKPAEARSKPAKPKRRQTHRRR